MAKILIKLKESSIKQFITTQRGYAILKNEWTEVEDGDREISRIILYRNDIDIKEIIKDEDIKENAPIKEVIEDEVIEICIPEEDDIKEEDIVVSSEEEIEIGEELEEPEEEMSEEEYIELKLKDAEEKKGKPLTKAQKNKIIKEIKN